MKLSVPPTMEIEDTLGKGHYLIRDTFIDEKLIFLSFDERFYGGDNSLDKLITSGYLIKKIFLDTTYRLDQGEVRKVVSLDLDKNVYSHVFYQHKGGILILDEMTNDSLSVECVNDNIVRSFGICD